MIGSNRSAAWLRPRFGVWQAFVLFLAAACSTLPVPGFAQSGGDRSPATPIDGSGGPRMSESERLAATAPPRGAPTTLAPVELRGGATTVFNYTGSLQTFVVPAGVTQIRIEASGAQGGDVTGQAPFPSGGRGATMIGDFVVVPGTVLNVVVGGKGNPDASTSGGGGGSGVTDANGALIVAGGGAGVDFQDPEYAGIHATTLPDGNIGSGTGGAGGTAGADGDDVVYNGTHISRGGRGFNSGATGSTGQNGVSANTTTTNGTFGLGGGGGSVGFGWCNCGGGGGGYSGGGAGQINTSGGGGGSFNAGTNQVNTAGDRVGDGLVTITLLTPLADLAITKTDGVPTATAGGTVTYTIVASNAGPTAVTDAVVMDTFPPALTCTWTCVGAGGGTCTAAGAGNINDTTGLPAGGSATYTATCSIAADATGPLSNTATIASALSDDPDALNNTATDTDILSAEADLSITKTDGVTTATPGGSVTYTITAQNTGPSNATGATVTDTFPPSLTATWTCVGAGGGTCTAAGAGDIGDTVNLPAGGSVTYTVSATISGAATGTLDNTATVTAPAGVTDPQPGNNSATDSDVLGAQADLSITKTDGVTTATPGGSVTYTITAQNAGPSDSTGATVTDTFPPSLTASWTCVGAGGGTCTAAGTGNISDTVNLPVGGSVTYTVSATISGAATGTLDNTATVTAPAGVTDPQPGNNSATDSDALGAQADLSITKTDGVTTATPGGSVTYTITAQNAGPSDATGATVTDTFPPSLTASWTCVGAGGGTCTAAGAGNIGDTVNLPVGGSVTYTVSATISGAATGTLDNTATVTAPAGVSDPQPGNNSATDSDALGAGPADVSVSKTLATPPPYAPGQALTYTLLVSNAGPAVANNVQVTDTPTNLAITAVSGGGCAALPCTIASLASGSSATITVTATIVAAGPFDNAAAVSSASPDSAMGNNTDATGNGGVAAGGGAAPASLETVPGPGPLVLALLALLLGVAGFVAAQSRSGLRDRRS